MRKHALSALLLLIILAFGSALRFTGQNWDDFSHTHPDELFLTLLVLPNLGGRNSFTDDDRFPEQQIFVLGGSTTIHSRADISDQPAARLGVVGETFAATAGEWLVGRERIDAFDGYGLAEGALLAGHVDALLVDRFQVPAHEAVHGVDSLSSVDLQSLRCRYLYPATDGIGGFFDARCSPLNPHNAGHGFFVTGHCPCCSRITAVKSSAPPPTPVCRSFIFKAAIWSGAVSQ